MIGNLDSDVKMNKFVKLNGYTYGCNSLTNFEYKVHEMTGNGSNVNLLTLGREKKIVKSLQVNLL